MLNRQLIIDHLTAYNEDELIYKRYYELREDPEAQKAFVDSLDPALVVGHNILIPGYPGTFFPGELKEDRMDTYPMFVQTPSMNVNVLKHYRYTPAIPHSHDYFEIIYMLTGTCHQTLDGEYLPLETGDICFIPPFGQHTLEIFDDSVALNIILRRSTFDEVFFHILRHSSVLSDFFNSSLYSAHPMKRLVFHTGEDEDIQDAVLEMYLEFTTGDDYSSALLENMVPILFAEILRRYSKTASILASGEKSDHRALELLSYIRDHYQDVTLNSLADHFHYSVSHCSRLIRKETGTGFTEFLRRIRCQYACTLLSSTDSSVARIAESCGYESPEVFIRAFEKQLHLTPTEYRRQHPASAHPEGPGMPVKGA